MEPAYQKFHDFIIRNRNHIELQLQEQRFDMAQLRGLCGSAPLNIKVTKNKKIHLG
jgi:hypothetical protein